MAKCNLWFISFLANGHIILQILSYKTQLFNQFSFKMYTTVKMSRPAFWFGFIVVNITLRPKVTMNRSFDRCRQTPESSSKCLFRLENRSETLPQVLEMSKGGELDSSQKTAKWQPQSKLESKHPSVLLWHLKAVTPPWHTRASRKRSSRLHRYNALSEWTAGGVFPFKACV